jgi:hypothetical protein
LPDGQASSGALGQVSPVDLAACERGIGQLICAWSKSSARRAASPVSKQRAMREYLMIWGVLSVGLALPLDAATAWGSQVPADDDDRPAGTKTRDANPLRMTPGIVCKSIDGFDKYERLPGAAQTADEKLLVYMKIRGFKIEHIDKVYRAHLVPDFEIRRRGSKAILLQKRKMFEYEPKSPDPLREIFMKSQISLKGLAPGEYDLTLILHDEVAKGPPASQIIRFKVIPADDPQKKAKESSPAGADPER